MKRSNLIAFIVTLVLFGTLLPLWKGIDFLDPILIVVSAKAQIHASGNRKVAPLAAWRLIRCRSKCRRSLLG